MHISEFFLGIRYYSPPLDKLRRLSNLVGIEQANHQNLGEVKHLFLAQKALDDYMAAVIGRELPRCSYANYPLSALVNFAAHQLTMRRFSHNGSQNLVQIGCFTGEEFVCGTVRNVSLECHLVHTRPIPIEIAAPAADPPAWQGPVRMMAMSAETYVREISPRIGALVLANLGGMADYRRTLDSVWNHLDKFADVIICGHFPIIRGLRHELVSDGMTCSDVFLRRQRSPEFEDDGIFILARERVDYLNIIEHDDR